MLQRFSGALEALVLLAQRAGTCNITCATALHDLLSSLSNLKSFRHGLCAWKPQHQDHRDSTTYYLIPYFLDHLMSAYQPGGILSAGPRPPYLPFSPLKYSMPSRAHSKLSAPSPAHPARAHRAQCPRHSALKRSVLSTAAPLSAHSAWIAQHQRAQHRAHSSAASSCGCFSPTVHTTSATRHTILC